MKYFAVVCGPGYGGNGSVCSPCPKGTYKPDVGNDTCTSCEAGETTPESGSVTRYLCNALLTLYVLWNLDWEISVRHIIVLRTIFLIYVKILSIPFAYFTGGCPAGYEKADGLCVPCKVGTAKSEPGDICPPCPLGFFANESGLLDCFPCLPGFYANLIGSTECKECRYGDLAEDRSNCGMFEMV